MKKVFLIATMALGILAVAPSVSASTVSMEKAAVRYENKANESAQKKSGKTNFKVELKGKVTKAQFRNAVANQHLAGVKDAGARKRAKKALADEILCDNWSSFSREFKNGKTTIKVVFDNNKMKTSSSYGKKNYAVEIVNEIMDTLAIFRGYFSEAFEKDEQYQLGCFAAMAQRDGSGLGFGGNWAGPKDRCGRCMFSCINGHKTNGCMGDAMGAAKIMRIVGVKKFGFTDSEIHRWNWWKGDDGTVYFGDSTGTGAEFDTENPIETVSGWWSKLQHLSSDYEMLFREQTAKTLVGDEYVNLPTKYDEEYDITWYVMTFTEYLERYPVRGFKANTIEQFKKRVRSGDVEGSVYATDGKKATDYKLYSYGF